MAPFGKIYSYPGNWRVQRAQVAAAINGLEVPVAEDFAMGKTNRTPEFLSKFPMGKIPALECADGLCIAESAAITYYLAGSGPAAEQLLGPAADVKTRAQITEWSHFSENEFTSNIMPPAVMCVYKLAPFDEKRYDMHVANFTRALKRLEVAVQGGKKYLVGSHLTLADIMVAGPLFASMGFLFDGEMKKEVPETVRYLQGLSELPEFKQFFGELKSIETRIKP
ncbi:glutathione S-transferase-like protein [Pestalotiopsis sp. NC0098]|nr:glutathione S-transferase-like protein [Pestalotiopsis sp. NC0098]